MHVLHLGANLVWLRLGSEDTNFGRMLCLSLTFKFWTYGLRSRQSTSSLDYLSARLITLSGYVMEGKAVSCRQLQLVSEHP